MLFRQPQLLFLQMTHIINHFTLNKCPQILCCAEIDHQPAGQDQVDRNAVYMIDSSDKSFRVHNTPVEFLKASVIKLLIFYV